VASRARYTLARRDDARVSVRDPFVAVRVDPSSRVPVSEQLAIAIERLIDRRDITPGERVPPVRSLADRLGLSPNTVAKAYRALEERGRLTGDGRRGTFVTSTSRLGSAATAFARRARELGVSDREAIAAVRDALRE
jgi:DNA-binding transcriptional regulator YhcF (GntR family)